MALTSEQRVTKAHIAIMRSKEFCMFAGVLSVGKVIFTDDLPTAATNGRDVMYNPSFIDTLSQDELNFVVLRRTSSTRAVKNCLHRCARSSRKVAV